MRLAVLRTKAFLVQLFEVCWRLTKATGRPSASESLETLYARISALEGTSRGPAFLGERKIDRRTQAIWLITVS